MSDSSVRLFALEATRDLGERISTILDVPLSEHVERDFEDGEHKTRPLVPVRDADVYVVHSLHGEPNASPNDKLCRLLFFLGAIRDAGAARVTAVVPYLCYARKDRKTKSRDPVTTRYVAALFEAMETDRLVTLDVHDLAAYQNAFRIRTEHLEARPLLVARFVEVVGDRDVTVVSPDAGGVKRAETFRSSLEEALGRPVGNAFMEKYRSRGEVSGKAFVGEVEGRVAIVLDDLIGSGTTMVRAASACRERGAVQIHAAATHGLFVGDAGESIVGSPLDSVVVTDTVPPFRLGTNRLDGRLDVLESAPLFAAAIRRIHEGGSIVELAERGP